MKKRSLGKNGLEISVIGLGCMTIGRDYSDDSKKEAIRIIRRACDLGITMFDTAELYGGGGRNESLIGEACTCVVIGTETVYCADSGDIQDGADGREHQGC